MESKMFSPEQQIEKQSQLIVESLSGYDEKTLEEILEVERKSFPEAWQIEGAEDHFKEILEDPKSINIILKRENEIVGYLSAIPHDELLKDEDFMAADPEFKPDSERYYIETAEIIPEISKTLGGGKAFLRMIDQLRQEAVNKFGISKFSMHARVNTGLSDVVRRIFQDKVVQVRRIENWPWYNEEEPTDYMEINWEGE